MFCVKKDTQTLLIMSGQWLRDCAYGTTETEFIEPRNINLECIASNITDRKLNETTIYNEGIPLNLI